ncbi:MAG: DNA polymerase III subunit delta [Candidatus Margulisiibacteriota bacterium]
MVHFIFGEETFLVEEAFQAVCRAYPKADKLVFEGKFDVEKLVQSALGLSLFSPQKLLILKSPFFLNGTVSDSEQKRLEAFFQDAQQSPNAVVIVVPGTLDQRRKWVQFLKKNAKVQDCIPFKDWEQAKVMQWMVDRLKSRGKTIAQEALFMLEQMGGTQLSHLASELDKVLVYSGTAVHITAQDVQAVCSPAGSSLYRLSEAMKKKQVPHMLAALQRLLEDGEEPIRLLGYFATQIRFYLQLLDLHQARKSPQEMAQLLGKNPFFIQKMLPDIAKAYTIDTLKKRYKQLHETDLLIKTGRCNPKYGLELFVIDFQS